LGFRVPPAAYAPVAPGPGPVETEGLGDLTKMWTCPSCNRRFTRKNQRHACGTGDRAKVLRNRPPEVVAVYAALEKFARTLGPVEFVMPSGSRSTSRGKWNTDCSSRWGPIGGT
jgi:hypothetical protein